MSTSRYASVGTAVWTAPSGSQVSYLLIRVIPQASTFSITATHVVRVGDRIDNIAYSTLGDPELSWLLADANQAMRPSDLNRPRLVIAIPGPPLGQ